MITLDLEKNEKQQELFDVVLREVVKHNTTETRKAAGELEYRYTDPEAIRQIFYGGAIRGGKTFGTLGLLVILSKIYPGSRWHIVRKSYPDLLRSTIPSMEKLIRGARVRWNRSTSNYFVEFENKSRIYFISENLKNDPLLNSFLGLETNGFLLEQEEELSPKTRERAVERSGSWYEVTPFIPPPFIFSTFNPTYGWLKKMIYNLWRMGELAAPNYFIEALPDHNPYVTAEQWAAWSKLDGQTYAQMIAGDWDIQIEGVFMHAFKEHRHLRRGMQIRDGRELWVSFDFNVDPMTAIIFQTDAVTYFRVFKEFRVPDSDTYELCAEVKEWMQEQLLFNPIYVTGDASGMNRISGARGHINQYEIIRSELGVPADNFEVPSANPFIVDSRTFCNSIFDKFPEVSVDPDGCPHLVEDLRFVLVGRDKEGKVQIEKKGLNKYTGIDNSQMGHLLDDIRYGMHVTLYDWVKIPHS